MYYLQEIHTCMYYFSTINHIQALYHCTSFAARCQNSFVQGTLLLVMVATMSSSLVTKTGLRIGEENFAEAFILVVTEYWILDTVHIYALLYKRTTSFVSIPYHLFCFEIRSFLTISLYTSNIIMVPVIKYSVHKIFFLSQIIVAFIGC